MNARSLAKATERYRPQVGLLAPGSSYSPRLPALSPPVDGSEGSGFFTAFVARYSGGTAPACPGFPLSADEATCGTLSLCAHYIYSLTVGVSMLSGLSWRVQTHDPCGARPLVVKRQTRRGGSTTSLVLRGIVCGTGTILSAVNRLLLSCHTRRHSVIRA